MRITLAVLLVLALAAAGAGMGAVPAFAAESDAAALERAVASYVTDARLVGGPGEAGYADGFWIRGGDFSLRVNLLVQARYEAFDWMDTEPAPGGDTSGFSLPRATLAFSGTAPCRTAYYVELEFGHHGGPLAHGVNNCFACFPNLGPDTQTLTYDVLREAWIEWEACPAATARFGLIPLPTTRQLMVRPKYQQFADISLASAWVGLGLPGYTDRNRDYGLMLHGAFGYDEEWTWMATVTNGDGGDSVRNVRDPRSSDNLAYGARLNYAPLGKNGYVEGAIDHLTCATYFEIGVWAFYYADRTDGPHFVEGDYLRYGVDAMLAYGGFTLTSAISYASDSNVFDMFDDDSVAFLAQAGYLFPRSAWEIAARFSGYETDGALLGDGVTYELATAINYYLDGYRNKLTVDASFIFTEDDGFLILDTYAAYPGLLTNREEGLLLRFQWQLAL